ncbi:MAG TPA: hypothetical protein PK322_11430 [Opitutaceae bacterium]|nr:hypothetical protein [Opitutaceae bacterium]
MAELSGLLGDDARAEGVGTDLLERAADAGRVAGELHGGGVGQALALAGDGGLDEAAEEVADVADDQEREAQAEQQGDEATAGILAAAGAAPGIGEAERVEQTAPDHGEHQDAVEHADEADVEPHVAVEDVAELVGDDTLELVAREFFETAAGDGDGGVAGREAGGEGVEAGLVLEHEDGGHGHAGGDGHLLDDVEQAALAGIGGTGDDLAAAGEGGHGAATAAQREPAVEGAPGDDEEGEDGGPSDGVAAPDEGGGAGGVGLDLHVLARVLATVRPGGVTESEGDDDIEGGDDQDDRDDEVEDEQRRAPAGGGLVFEEVHKNATGAFLR